MKPNSFVKKWSISFISLSFFFSGCAGFKIPLLSESAPIGQPLPSSLVESSPDTEWVAIAGLNDFHGTLLPLKMKTKDTTGRSPVEYSAGGAAVLASYIRVLQNEFHNRFLLLDAGDTFQGTLESNFHEGRSTLAFYNALGVDASTIGNHEFDYGPAGPDVDLGPQVDLLGALKALMQGAHYPYLNSNVYGKDKKAPYPFPNSSPDKLFQVGRVKIGVIGGSTLETPTTTRSVFLRDVTFAPLAPIIKQRAQMLRAAGANAVVLVAHVGLSCARPAHFNHSLIRKAGDPQGDCIAEDEMTVLLHDLPRGTLDAVVSGHSHQVIHHWVNGTPVIQGGSRGSYLNIIYLKFNLAQQTPLKPVSSETIIEGPIPVCERIFKNQGDCNGDRIPPKQGRGALVTPVFHGKSISVDSEIKSLLSPYLKESETEQERKIGNAPELVKHLREGDSPLGKMIADSLREIAKTDFALINPGGIRSDLQSGSVTYGDLFRVIPFDNAISILKVNGTELKRILSVAQNGARGFFPVSGLKLRVIGLNHQVAAQDRDKDGKLEPWEMNRLIEVKTQNNEPIIESKMYTLATPDFLVTGGDDMGWVMNTIPKERVFLDSGYGWIREAVETSLLHKKEIVAPSDMRIYQEAPPLSSSRSKKKRRR